MNSAIYAKLLVTGLIGMGIAAMPFPTMARGMSNGVILVSVRVAPSAALRFEVTPVELVIGARDIERGYIEVPASALLNIKPGGLKPDVVLDFSPVEGWFKSIEVRTENGWMPVASGKEVAATVLSYRFNLVEQAAPGRHPVRLTLNINL